MVVGRWTCLRGSRHPGIGRRSWDSACLWFPSSQIADRSRYKYRRVALDHAEFLEAIRGQDRMRRETLCQEFLAKGSVLWKRRHRTGNTIDRHLKKAKKLEKERNYCSIKNVALIFVLNAQFDWNMTRNENVADIGALQISHKTWHTLTNGKDRSLPGLEGLRPSQLFFISAAQVNNRFSPRIILHPCHFYSRSDSYKWVCKRKISS